MARAKRLIVLFVLLIGAVASAETFEGDRTNLKRVIKQLQAGDTLVLAPDDYKDVLEIENLEGKPDAWIVIKGPDSGPQPRLLGTPAYNTVEIRGCAYLAIENLTIDGQGIDGIFAVSASAAPSHHIRIENCTIVGHGAHQGTVAISTKAPAWSWVIRGNRIVGAGTGMYLGDSDGRRPFVAGLIEYNLFLGSKGYNVQIKHQTPREAIPGMPTAPQKTILRHNVFLKGEMLSESGERPNVLVGAQPERGIGSEDSFEIYGNLFGQNHDESLLQAEGRVSIHDNIFVDCTGDAVHLQNHYGKVRRAYVYNNTFYRVETAVRFVHPALDDHLVAGNLMFSDHAIVGEFKKESNNLHASVESARNYVREPSLLLGEMDFYPLPGKCKGAPIDLARFADQADSGRDFNGTSKGDATCRGAYAGEGANPGWQLDAKIKGAISAPSPEDDHLPPTGSILIAGGRGTASALVVDLEISAEDAMSGMGPGAQMRFSNDGKTWSAPEPYGARRIGWDLSSHGGTADAGIKVVYARVRDMAGNWSQVLVAAIEYQGAASGGPPAR